jgi:hypothetical protein
MSWQKGGEKHCGKLRAHDEHYWFGRGDHKDTAYWCKGWIVMEGGYFGPRTLRQEDTQKEER